MGIGGIGVADASAGQEKHARAGGDGGGNIDDANGTRAEAHPPFR